MGMPEVIVTACWEMNRRVLIISMVTESSPVQAAQWARL